MFSEGTGVDDVTMSSNGDLSKWNVAQVENMSELFCYASSFNGDLSAWDVKSRTHTKSVTDMFKGARKSSNQCYVCCTLVFCSLFSFECRFWHAQLEEATLDFL